MCRFAQGTSSLQITIKKIVRFAAKMRLVRRKRTCNYKKQYVDAYNLCINCLETPNHTDRASKKAYIKSNECHNMYIIC